MGGETSDDSNSDTNGPDYSTLKKDRLHKNTKISRKTIIKSKRRDQKYRSEWEKNLQFRLWLCPVVSNVFKASCRYCNAEMKAELTVLKLHAQSKKHKDRCTDVRPEVQEVITKFTTPVGDDKVKNAEILLSGCLAAHNIPFAFMDHLTEVLKKCFVDSKIAEMLKLKRSKAAAIVKNVLGESQKEQLIKKLKMTKFSVLTDESTDIAAVKTSCVVVRYFDEDCGRITSRLWDLIQVFGSDRPTSTDCNYDVSANAEHLFNLILDSFDKHNIPRENIIGFASDGCNTMMGIRNSVASRFRNTCPGITVMKCLCHSLHLCASEACKKLPRNCEDLTRNIYNFFKSSSKRQYKLVEFQVFLNLDIHKVLHPSQTRWLSLASVVDRILEQWDASRLFFDDEYLNLRLMAVEEIHRQMNNPFMKAFYLFLQWALPKFTNLNKYFQSESVIVTSMHNRMTLAYRDILNSYLTRDYVDKTPLQDIDPENEQQYVPLANLYLGVGVMQQLQNAEVLRYPDLIDDLKQRCRDFLSTGCTQIRKRYDFNDTLLSTISILEPKKALSSAERSKTPSIIPLTEKMPRVTPTNTAQLQSLDDEWRQIPLIEFPDEIVKCAEIDVFWAKVSKYTDSEGEPYLKVLPSFALAALSIPHSNAQCERIFSKVNLVKTKSRNRLITSSITGCLLASECIKGTSQNECCKAFKPSNDMFHRMIAKNLYPATAGDKSTSEKSSSDKSEVAESVRDDDEFTFGDEIN